VRSALRLLRGLLLNLCLRPAIVVVVVVVRVADAEAGCVIVLVVTKGRWVGCS
jgi:hypothetical protein